MSPAVAASLRHPPGTLPVTDAEPGPSGHIRPHTLRHTTTGHLLQFGGEITVMASWLVHQDTATNLDPLAHTQLRHQLHRSEAHLHPFSRPPITNSAWPSPRHRAAIRSSAWTSQVQGLRQTPRWIMRVALPDR
jgi:hypothetical protein